MVKICFAFYDIEGREPELFGLIILGWNTKKIKGPGLPGKYQKEESLPEKKRKITRKWKGTRAIPIT